MRTCAWLILLFAPMLINAQHVTGTVRGRVVDAFTNVPLQGANVVLMDSITQIGTTTNAYGEFEILKVPVGRQTIVATYVGYKVWMVGNIFVSSGKEVVLPVKLEDESKQITEVTVMAKRAADTKNTYSYVSGRAFNVEDTERYSGTNGDPARMATYFAGVMAAGDTRNDIIIRGNSPLGLLWRVEGVDIPNPSHFASMGTNGGAMSILNNNLLANSDFLSGAFPAHYGNALSGVFDLSLRNGNNQKRETTVQLGSGGVEVGIEGFFSRERNASYLVNYRYSFLEFFSKVGVDMKIPAIPKYQDLSFKFHLPTGRLGHISVWGIGGQSSMVMLAGNNTLNATKGVDTRMGSGMGVVGLSHLYTFGNRSLLRTSLAVNGYETNLATDSVRSATVQPIYGNHCTEGRLVVASVFKHRVNSMFRFEVGATLTNFITNYNDSANVNSSFVYLTQSKGRYSLIQGFGQTEIRLASRTKMTAGIHAQQLLMNRTYSVEPRMAFSYEASPRTSIYTGAGLHSQVQPANIYFHKTLVDTLSMVYAATNSNLDFSKSMHVVAGAKHRLSSSTSLKAEVYFQHLFNVPVESKASTYSSINFGADYYSAVNDSLVNKGLGRNFGAEFTIERVFSKGFYYLATLSLYQSKYMGSDCVWRSTMYNGNFIVNLLGGYEFKLPKSESLAINANVVWAGGLRYTPIDVEMSMRKGMTLVDNSRAYQGQHRDFFKANVKVVYRINKSKYSYESGFGVTNITNRKNILMQSVDTDKGTVVNDYQMGLMPEGLFRIYF